MGSAEHGPGVAAVVPAKDEAERIGATVRAVRSLPGVDMVVVVDDGSTDGTAEAALAAGARVLRHARNRGKGAAMESGAEGVRLIEAGASGGGPPRHRHLLFLDADLGATASGAAPLITPVVRGDADMAVALFPATRMRLGGHGFVVRLARDGIRRATGWEPEQPLNGQRCLTRAAFESALPLAHGFGVETGLTIDVLHAGLRVVEVEVPLEHRATGTDLRAQVHRARQFADVGRALAARELGPALARRARRTGRDAAVAIRSVSRKIQQSRRRDYR
ncbi:glycosyltransferase [Nocardiopsis sp. RSe5-2]|uniref:Glucosyl-3-phosphoglycerate synthase n=1 Tax=Nocardiopsis endophytica TaxID=3018445 RepID=A0ABT4U352_9ACTN|nr:glycosyltransferase [Nocardiopsis endophytica]MDA2811389.1 glycosyltransferase [Nocardiopsis endophytica]